MQTLFSLYSRLKRLDVDAATEVAFELSEEDFARINREQMTEGFGSDGSRFKKYANPTYAAKKQAMNPQPGYGNPDLKLTGSFQRQLRVDVDGDKVRIYSLDEKSAMLEKKYPSAFGLGGAFRALFLDMLQPRVVDQIRAKLFGGNF